jgi:hypothetical protein
VRTVRAVRSQRPRSSARPEPRRRISVSSCETAWLGDASPQNKNVPGRLTASLFRAVIEYLTRPARTGDAVAWSAGGIAQ